MSYVERLESIRIKLKVLYNDIRSEADGSDDNTFLETS